MNDSRRAVKAGAGPQFCVWLDRTSQFDRTAFMNGRPLPMNISKCDEDESHSARMGDDDSALFKTRRASDNDQVVARAPPTARPVKYDGCSSTGTALERKPTPGRAVLLEDWRTMDS